MLQAAHPGDSASLADLDTAAAQTLGSAPQTAAGLALRALELTPPADPGMLPRVVAATETLTAAGRLDQAARLAQHTLAKPLPPAAEDLAVLLTRTDKHQATRHLKTAIDGYRQVGAARS